MSMIEETIKAIRLLDQEAMAAAQRRQDALTKPAGSLGRLEELAMKIAGITGQPVPKIESKVIITMAGDHGVVAEGVSLYPQEVTAQMVYNFLRGGAAINVLASHAGARVVVVDMGVREDLEPLPNLVIKKIRHGTANMAQGPAMSREKAIQAIEAGIEVVEAEAGRGLDIMGTGDMGIGNTTPSSAIVAVFTGASPSRVTGRGTGVGDTMLDHKIRVVDKALAINKPDPKDPIGVLAKVGGYEIGGLVGVILGAAAKRIPVVIDGFISTAAAIIATALAPLAKDYLLAGHRSAEIGHSVALEYLGLEPILDLKMRLGEGTGAVLAMFIVEAAVRALRDMATFREAGVSEAEGRT